MKYLGGGNGYGNCRNYVATDGPPNFLESVFEDNCVSLVAHCHGSVSHELHCWLVGDINIEPLTVPLECISVSYSVV